MPHTPDDTVAARATAPGGSARAALRLSGPGAHAAVAALPWIDAPAPGPVAAGTLRLPGVHAPFPVEVWRGTAPATYTGQDTAELHCAGCPPLVDLLEAAVLAAGARPAGRGEFTLRAFLNRKRDLPRAEAVAAVIDASAEDELRLALAQLAGGVTGPLSGLREDLLDLLADVEAGLDFGDEEDIPVTESAQTLLRLTKAMAQITLVQKKLAGRAVVTDRYRVALVGEPNAGKSSLFNALIDDEWSIVSPEAGTTRDAVARTLKLGGGLTAELIDTAGTQEAADDIAAQSQEQRREQTRLADVVVWCVEHAALDGAQPPLEAAGRPLIRCATKCDAGQPAPPGWIATSAATRLGLATLAEAIRDAGRAREARALSATQARLRGHVDRCLAHLRRAHSLALFDDPPELLAAEIRLALDEVGELVGAVFTDDLLDRVFSRFCIGK